MDHARRFFRILTEPAAVRFVTRLLAALAALEMLEVFFGCSFSMKLPFLLLPAASLLAGELSGRPLLGLFSGAVLTLLIFLLFIRYILIYCGLLLFSSFVRFLIVWSSFFFTNVFSIISFK